MYRWMKTQIIKKLTKRDGGYRCFYCWIPLRERSSNPDLSLRARSETGTGYPTIDHYIPQTRGGSDNLYNLRLCCTLCNREKGDDPGGIFYETKAHLRRKRGQSTL